MKVCDICRSHYGVETLNIMGTPFTKDLCKQHFEALGKWIEDQKKQQNHNE